MKPETHPSEVIGLGMAVIVLLLTFDMVVAMGLPFITAIVGLVCGLSIITLISHVAEVPTVAPTLATMIGLGVGIDYALFIVTRHLSSGANGWRRHESIARAPRPRAARSCSPAPASSSRCCSLAVVGHPAGHDARLHVGAGRRGRRPRLASPCCRRSWHRRRSIDRLALPHRRAAHDGHPHGWERWARLVARRPLPALLVAVAVLGALALPALDLYLGQQDNGALPKSTDARARTTG